MPADGRWISRFAALSAALLLSMPVMVSCGDDEAPTADDAQDRLVRSFDTPDAAEICAATRDDCGRDPRGTDDHPVTVAVKDLQRAFLEGDVRTLCAGTTRAAQLQAGSMAHGTPSSCRADMRRALSLFDGKWEGTDNPDVANVRASGSSAVATVVAEGGREAEIPFARQGGRWKLNGFFGQPAADEARYMAEAKSSPYPAIEDGALTVGERPGKRCPRVNVEDFPSLEGGCLVKLLGRMRITAMTVFGAFEFGNCTLSTGFRVDPIGRTWTEYLLIDGPNTSGCNDVDPCQDPKSSSVIPWRGRLEPSGRQLSQRAFACLSTCVGIFIGELVMQIDRDADARRAAYVEGDVGLSGFRFDAPKIDIEPRTLEINVNS